MSIPVSEWAISAMILRDQRGAQTEQRVGQAVMGDGRNAGIAGQYFVDAASGRIAFVSGVDIGFQHGTRISGKLAAKCRTIANGLFAMLVAGRVLAGDELQLANDLLNEFAQGFVERVSHEIVDAFADRARCVARRLETGAAIRLSTIVCQHAVREGSFAGVSMRCRAASDASRNSRSSATISSMFQCRSRCSHSLC